MLSQWTQTEIEDQLSQRVEFSKRAIGKLLQVYICIRAATILRLLGNEVIQFSTRVKKSELGIRKQLNTDVKSTTKLIFSKNI